MWSQFLELAIYSEINEPFNCTSCDEMVIITDELWPQLAPILTCASGNKRFDYGRYGV